MRIFAAPPLYPPYSRVGAWLATHSLLSFAAVQGHDVAVAPSMRATHSMILDGVELHDRRRSAELAARADVVVGHSGDDGTAARLAADAGRPLVQMFHGLPAAIAPTVELVVFNSATSQAAADHDGRSVVCRPWTDAAAHRVTPGDRVTIVNCSREKGIKTAWRAADLLPGIPFLGVLGGYGQQHRPRALNFETVATVADMRSVWSRTRILLMPSQAETWGMVGVEAMASGIPVIASDLPGLRESLDTAGTFLDPSDTGGWVREIRRLQDPDEWNAASERALKRSAELAADDPRPRFVSALESVVEVAA